MEWREVGAVAVDDKDNVYVFNRGPHPMMVFDREGNFLRSWGEGLYKRAHGAHCGARRHAVAHRRRRPHGAPVHDGGQSAADDRHPRPAHALHEPGAVQPLHAHRAFAAGRPVHLRRLRQRTRAQVLARRQAPVLVGRAGHGSRPVQPAAQHLLRRRRLGLRRRPREPPRAGVRRQRQATRRSGTTCTGRAALYMPRGKCPICYIGEMRAGHGRQSRRHPTSGRA